ncbi:MAG: pentapeptide repeat-containing protein, partial [Proteobacteria bacterium]|nr:pentapeptide repeat-containing protein [Pseudomonadota bacterium]
MKTAKMTKMKPWRQGPTDYFYRYSHGQEIDTAKYDFSCAKMVRDSMADYAAPGINFTGTDLTGSNGQHSDFSGGTFVRSNLQSGVWAYTNFSGADMRGANLNADFEHASFKGADLRDADGNVGTFRKCNLSNADLRGGKFRFADFTGSNLQ